MEIDATRLTTLKPVDIRTVWPHEAHHFTPWLAEHIGSLGDALGIELELDEREASVGDFSLDLLARDLGTDRPVVIENQFGPTDHDHLGKLLTYAAGFDASAVIWVGESVREEHRQTLDWLNQRTDSDTHFFAVIVELLQIDDSRPAYNFRPIVFPNEWQKDRKRPRSLSSRSEAYRQYFQKLIDVLREEHRFTGARIGQAQSWYAFASGVSGVSYGASFAQGGRARTDLYIGTSDAEFNEALFDWLYDQRDALGQECDKSLEWERLKDRVASRVALYRNGAIDDGAETLEQIRAWHVASLLQLKKAFGPKLDEFKRKH